MFEGRYKMWKVVLRDAFKHPIMGWGLDSFRNAGTFKPFIYMQNAMTRETKAVSLSAIQVYNETGVMPPMPGFIKQGDALDIWDNPHNEYIMLFYEFGLVGVILFGLFCSDIVKRFYVTDELIAIIGVFIVFLIISTGQFPFHVVRLGYIFPVLVGAYYKINEEIKQGELIYGS
jgi:O-antigen ligase